MIVISSFYESLHIKKLCECDMHFPIAILFRLQKSQTCLKTHCLIEHYSIVLPLKHTSGIYRKLRNRREVDYFRRKVTSPSKHWWCQNIQGGSKKSKLLILAVNEINNSQTRVIFAKFIPTLVEKMFDMCSIVPNYSLNSLSPFVYTLVDERLW